MPVLMQYGARTYRASAGFLQAPSGIRVQPDLAAVPRYAAPQKAEARIDPGTLRAVIGLSVSGTSSAGATAGADATGFDTGVGQLGMMIAEAGLPRERRDGL